MIVKTVKISIQTKIKIYNKHGITMEEIKNTLLEDEPYFAKAKLERYVALGKWNRYITIVFTYNLPNKEADIITAYPSADWQIKLYKRKKGI